MRRVAVARLPDDPLAASSQFLRDWLDPVARAAEAGEDVLVTLDPADHTHGEWRRAAAAMLARRHTPRRVNIVAGEDGDALEAVTAYLANAPGVTGQYLESAG